MHIPPRSALQNDRKLPISREAWTAVKLPWTLTVYGQPTNDPNQALAPKVAILTHWMGAVDRNTIFSHQVGIRNR